MQLARDVLPCLADAIEHRCSALPVAHRLFGNAERLHRIEKIKNERAAAVVQPPGCSGERGFILSHEQINLLELLRREVQLINELGQFNLGCGSEKAHHSPHAAWIANALGGLADARHDLHLFIGEYGLMLIEEAIIESANPAKEIVQLV